jgi:hypothetical protein
MVLQSITRILFFPIFFSDFGKPLEKKILLKKNWKNELAAP